MKVIIMLKYFAICFTSWQIKSPTKRRENFINISNILYAVS